LPVSAQEFGKWGITAYGGASFPTGDFYNTGYGGAAGVIYDFKYNTRFVLTLGYTQWEVDEAAVNNNYKNNDGIGTINIEAPLTTIPLLLQARWYTSRESINFYALLEIGFYFTKSEISGSVTENDTTLARFSGKESSTNTGVNLGLGVTIEISKNIEFDVTGKYHIVSTNNVYNFAPVGQPGNILVTEQYWSIAAGINIIIL